MKFLPAFVVAVTALASTLCARVDLLLVPPTIPVASTRDFELTLYLNNPTSRDEVIDLPEMLPAVYASADGHHHTTLVLADSLGGHRDVRAMTRAEVKLRLAEPLLGEPGFISLRLTQPETNAIMFELASSAAPALRGIQDASGAKTPPKPPTSIKPGQHLDLTSDLEGTRRHISSYDPVYFAIGARERLNAHFQFSFKFRVFEPSSLGAPLTEQLIRELYVAYTQTSIWDLETFSKPFYDSSYRPTVFLLHDFRRIGNSSARVSVQVGAQHESNGRGGLAPTTPGTGLGSPTTSLRHPSDSRSVNSLYFAPKIRWTADNDLFFELTARASAYFQIDENPDIARYRGHVELTLRSGYDRGVQLSAQLRGNPQGHGSMEFNATWPAIETPLLKLVLPATLGGYAQIQYFNGYGESLLDYDVRRKDQLRFGLTIVR
jgi:outer membrane phospholipase A